MMLVRKESSVKCKVIKDFLKKPRLKYDCFIKKI